MAFETLLFQDKNLPVSPFLGLLGEHARGQLSAVQVQTAVEERTGELTEDQETDLISVLDSITAAETFTDKMEIILAIRDVFDLAEYDKMATVYPTADSVKTRLGFI
jgi:hypothetical protein